MKSLSHKLLAGALLLAVGLGLLWEYFELPNAKPRLARLPLVGARFIGREIGMTDWEKDFFQDVHVMKRFYRVGGQTFFVTILDGTRDRHAVHDPFYCFRGEGWTLNDRVTLAVPGGEAHIMRMEKNGENFETMYWFTNGDVRHASMLKYLWQTTLRRLTLGQSGSEPVRVMIQPIDASTLDWAAIVDDFPELFEL
jgi:hypothetical protein